MIFFAVVAIAASVTIHAICMVNQLKRLKLLESYAGMSWSMLRRFGDRIEKLEERE